MNARIRTVLLTLLTSLSASVAAAPVGFSVNSDSGTGEDRLYSIDLADGSTTPIGFGIYEIAPPALIDVEGLALAPDGTLWGVDDESRSLFRVEKEFGNIAQGSRVTIDGLDASLKNDFGLAFTCEGALYASSVASQSLYQLDQDGNATRKGALGSLGVNISAIASFGVNPVRLVGLGNGRDSKGLPDNRSLYEINPEDGTTKLIGPLGDGVADYDQAGLSFDSDGKLYAITDRSALSAKGEPSQVLSIDADTGTGTVLSETQVIGFESLAVAPPAGCDAPLPVETIFDLPYDIPTIDQSGKLLAILALLLTGLIAIRQRLF